MVADIDPTGSPSTAKAWGDVSFVATTNRIMNSGLNVRHLHAPHPRSLSENLDKSRNGLVSLEGSALQP